MKTRQKQWSLTDLFDLFIKDCYRGKRLKKDGRKIKRETIENYEAAGKLLKEFEKIDDKRILISGITGNNQRKLLSERNRWKKFYRRFTDFLYKRKGCYDNYVGNVIKIIRVFFNYLKSEKALPIGDFHKQFYICKEEIPILTLLPEQLYFLINDTEFENKLSPALKKSKDIFVFGCTVGLRFSDLMKIRFTDVEKAGSSYYLNAKSGKTEIMTKVKLPGYALKIIQKPNKKTQKKKTLLPSISKNQFNNNIKCIGEKAGWINAVLKRRSKRGREYNISKPGNTKTYRFCDLLSSHVMRRTAVTIMLMLGMPEHVVKKISGHTSDSKAFYRYVNIVQSYLDTHIDKMHNYFSTNDSSGDLPQTRA